MGVDTGQEALVGTVEAEDFLVEGVKESVLLGDDGLKLDDAAYRGRPYADSLRFPRG